MEYFCYNSYLGWYNMCALMYNAPIARPHKKVSQIGKDQIFNISKYTETRMLYVVAAERTTCIEIPPQIQLQLLQLQLQQHDWQSRKQANEQTHTNTEWLHYYFRIYPKRGTCLKI